VIRFDNVGLRYGLGPEVLRDVSFRIDPGSFQFVTGPSGAGKTSLPRSGAVSASSFRISGSWTI
jgi:cell division transport system ATP-binding protein